VTCDLLIRNGRVLDPEQGLDEVADVAMNGDRIAAVAPGLGAARAARTLDASNCLVLPGLIDMHTHAYWGGDPISLEADSYLAVTATTTWVDAGSAGAANFAGFRRFLIEPSRTRIIPFLNVSTPGLAAVEVVHNDIRHLDADAAFRKIEENRGLIRGIKVLSCATRVGPNGLIPLQVALEVGRATNLPVMCHIGAPPPGLAEMLPLMRAGDIITHTYKGRKGCLVVAGGRVRDEAWQARERGVLFDVGHGAGSFSWEVARQALDQGFPPDCISTDLHAGSVAGGTFHMPAVMSRFLHLGMELAQVVRLSTSIPARLLGLTGEIGTLACGACADVAVLKLEQGEFAARDCEGVTEVMGQRLTPLLTIRAGQVVS
jgi:dihydroorotase